ncbi:hypothetical protein CYMTET_40980, partial [Cymbomonas tetramitiformis]
GALACQSPDYTDAELCYHLPLEDYQYYLRIRQRRIEEAMAREMEARRLDELKSVVDQLRACKQLSCAAVSSHGANPEMEEVSVSVMVLELSAAGHSVKKWPEGSSVQ